MPHPLKVAVIGSGITGLSVAYTLRDHADVTLFEAANYFGGHTHTVDVSLPDAAGRDCTHGVDTGFLVFNERTYPNLIRLMAELGVETTQSDMSFSVQVPNAFDSQSLEWSGSDLNTVFAQRSNLVRPAFWGMLRDLMRFNRRCTGLAQARPDADAARVLAQPLGSFLKDEAYGAAFVRWYLLPMLGCIWSCPTDQMLAFPVATMVRFCHNHGLIQVTNRPQWHTIKGGAKHYVDEMLSHVRDARLNTPVRLVERDASSARLGVRVITDGKSEAFDKVVFATHSDQSLAMLHRASDAERAVLGAIRYQANRAVLHTDVRVMPKRRLAWAAWNYERAAGGEQESARVCLHYWLNRLQPLPFAKDVIVSLNPVSTIDPSTIMGEYEYAHPVFDGPAIAAQIKLTELQGQQHSYFCGAWAGYGFHEDGHKSGLQVARHLLIAAEQLRTEVA